MGIINIKEELKLSDDLDAVISKLDVQQEELNQKQHIFRMLRFVDSVDKLKDLEDTKLLNIIGGSIAYGYDREENEYFLWLDFRTASGDKIDYSLDKMLRNKCKFPNSLDVGYLSDNFKLDKIYFFNFNKDLKKDLLELLLSKELKAVLEYNEIDNELNNKSEPVLKKHKL